MKKIVPSITSNEYKCLNCPKIFKHNSSFCRHKLVCGNETQTPGYDCKTCGRTFDRADTLKRHVKVCKGIEKKIIKCDRCDKEFMYQWYLTRHQQCCVRKCKTCSKKIEDGDDHVCRGLLVQLPKNRRKGANKIAETSSSEYEQPPTLWDLTELATLLELGYASSDTENPVKVNPSQAQAAPDLQHDIDECAYCLPLLPGSVVDFQIDCVPGNDDIPIADLAVAPIDSLPLIAHASGSANLSEPLDASSNSSKDPVNIPTVESA